MDTEDLLNIPEEFNAIVEKTFPIVKDDIEPHINNDAGMIGWLGGQTITYGMLGMIEEALGSANAIYYLGYLAGAGIEIKDELAELFDIFSDEEE